EFVRVTQNSTRNVTLTVYSDGETSTKTLSLNRTMGVEVKYALEGYPAAKAGLQEGDVITRIGNRTVTNFTTFSSALSGREANETVEIEYLRDGNATVVTVTLANRRGDQGGFLGVAYYTPVEKLGIAPYDIGAVYSLLSSLNPVNWIASVYLPFAGALGGSSFFGFEGTVAEFYRLGGIASLLGGFYWTLINIVYWTAWINFNLGIFNCVPAIPLDGGHIFREGAKKALRPVKDEERRERFAGYAAGGLALVMFGSMLMMIIAPRFLR
ncbi:MAG: M50 family metallopeptidase, partial [Halobacteria archaeon]|nr:M50 family metallopeptidase [Halobacteria archaeon]